MNDNGNNTGGEASAVTTELRGHVLLVGLNRPAKRNAFNLAMMHELAQAYGRIERDDEIRAGVIYAHGDHFTGGLDLAEVAGIFGKPEQAIPEGGLDPWRNDGTRWTTPVIVATQGLCYTAGVELALAADIRVASADTRFLQFEVQRGIFPFGGATTRFVREAGWGNAMRWILTGEEFGAEEALRMGVVQEVVAAGTQLDRAIELAQFIAERAAPLAVRGALASAHRALDEGHDASVAHYTEDIATLLGSEDAQEGVRSFIERRQAKFTGR
ncbi:MAG: crotonase/enoyl-CoA hydratase family protein [Actinobacteria bacterium]|nr:crotonase/enoyl-CoA hydratase family protein [Actinomycetota bacterium]